MININVKNIQDGKIVSNIKEVIKVYATFVRHDEANKSIENYDLQQRLHPLAEIESNEIISGSFDDTLENIQLQEYLLEAKSMAALLDSEKMPIVYKVEQNKYIYSKQHRIEIVDFLSYFVKSKFHILLIILLYIQIR